MTNDEAIKQLELLKAQIEWDYSIEYQIAIDIGIEAIKERDVKESEEV